jgi:hypothetical protein
MGLDLASAGATRLAVESMGKNISAAINQPRRVKQSLVWREGSPLGGSSRLTVSPASTNVALISLRAVDLAWRLRSFVTNRHE